MVAAVSDLSRVGSSSAMGGSVSCCRGAGCPDLLCISYWVSGWFSAGSVIAGAAFGVVNGELDMLEAIPM